MSLTHPEKVCAFFFSFFFAAALSKYSVFLIFRYKQSHSGNDAEMNMVAECTITIPSAPVGGKRERERDRDREKGRERGLAVGKEREREAHEMRETGDRGSARMGRVEDL